MMFITLFFFFIHIHIALDTMVYFIDSVFTLFPSVSFSTLPTYIESSLNSLIKSSTITCIIRLYGHVAHCSRTDFAYQIVCKRQTGVEAKHVTQNLLIKHVKESFQEVLNAGERYT